MLTGIRNGRVITPGGVVEGLNVYFEGGLLIAVTDSELPCDAEIDARGNYVSPGFIDIHTHGGGDADFLDCAPEAFLRAARLHASHGTTTLLPTATSGTLEETLSMLRAYEAVRKMTNDCADMPGLHLEGPYFSMEQRGAQNPKQVRAPDPEEYMRVLDASEHILRWSAAPELPGALEFARELKRRGILASIGHTSADYGEVAAAVEAGYSHVTHLYSCMSTVHRKNAFRYAGVVESAYLMDELSVEIIADGVHLPQELLRFAYRFKGPDKIALVTDSMRGAGMPDGKSILGSRENGQEVIIEDGVAKLPDRSAFAGSVATAERLVRNMIILGGATLFDAVKMATATPARIMGFADRGALEAGKRADIALFDENINVASTIVGGKTVYKREESD